MFHYKARVVKIVDGDTIDVDIDLGFGITKRERVRLLGINTPELHVKAEAEAGAQAKAFVVDWVAKYSEVELKTVKSKYDKYGRYLAEVWHPEGGSLSDVLLHAGLASPYAC